MASIIAFLKALPEMVKIVGQLNQTMILLANRRTERETAEIKEQINVLTKRLETSKGERDEISNIIRDLNSLKL